MKIRVIHQPEKKHFEVQYREWCAWQCFHQVHYWTDARAMPTEARLRAIDLAKTLKPSEVV